MVKKLISGLEAPVIDQVSPSTMTIANDFTPAFSRGYRLPMKEDVQKHARWMLSKRGRCEIIGITGTNKRNGRYGRSVDNRKSVDHIRKP